MISIKLRRWQLLQRFLIVLLGPGESCAEYLPSEIPFYRRMGIRPVASRGVNAALRVLLSKALLPLMQAGCNALTLVMGNADLQRLLTPKQGAVVREAQARACRLEQTLDETDGLS
nr:hypothetical protein [Chromobacterium paludis]